MKVIFKYYAINIEGKKIRGKYDVEDINELGNLLRDNGYFLYNYKAGLKDYKLLFQKRVSFQDLSIFCSTLGTMVAVGMTFSQILDILIETQNNQSIKKSLHEVKKSVNKGESIYQSMKRFPKVYPLFLLEMIRIGEEGGKLDLVLEKLSKYYEGQQRTFDKIKTALTYPLITLVISIFMIIFLIMRVVPQFTEILSSLGGETPILTKVLLDLCSFLKSNFLIISAAFTLFIFLIFNFSKSTKGKMYLDKIKMKIPFFSKLYIKFITARFSTGMGMLMSSGFNIVKALEITSSLLENQIMENRIYNSIEGIKKGDSVYRSFKNHSIGNNTFISLVHTGEETGNLDNMLIKAGEIFSRDVEDSLKKLITYIEPMLILFLTFFIGAFIIAGLMPIFSIMDSMG